MNRLPLYSLPVKIGFFSLVISLIGMLVIGMISYNSSADLLEQQALQGLGQDLEREESLMLEKVRTLRDDIDLLSQSNAISGVIRAQDGAGYDDQENMTLSMWRQRFSAIAHTVMRQRPIYQSIQLHLLDESQPLLHIERNGEIVLDKTQVFNQDHGDFDWARKQLFDNNKEQIWVSDPKLLKSAGQIVYPPQSIFYAGQLIYDRYGIAAGVLVVQVDFDKIMDNLRLGSGPVSYFAANMQGQYLSHPSLERNWAYELNPQLTLKRDFEELTRSDIKLFDRDGVIHKGNAASSDLTSLELESHDLGLALRRLPMTHYGLSQDIIIGAVTDLEYLRHESAGLLKRITVVMFIGVLLLVMASIVLAYHITKPLLKLKTAADKITAGERNTHIPVQGDDEIASLGQSIQAMLEHLNQSQQDLADANSSLEQKVASRTEELEKALEQANEASVAKAQFLATMSHEIRTPLNGVLGMTELVLNTPLNMLQRRHLETVKRSGETLLNLLNDILDLSKIEAGKFNIHVAEFNPNELLENCVLLYADNANRKGLELIPVTLPRLSHYLKGDADRINQILMNLVNNAIKFTDKGEVVVSVEIIDEQADQLLLRFKVIDTGIGISDSQCKKLFQKFVQLDSSSTRKYAGTGLGLAISRQLVELMGGEIKLDSDVGQGTRIWFDLPLQKGSQCFDITEEHQALLNRTATLIVDDNSTNRELLHHIVISWGMQNGSESHAKAAFERLVHRAREGNPYQMVLVDQMMPDISGLEMVQMIKQEPDLAELKIIMLSSMDMEDSEQAMEAGVDYYLRKPFRQSELYDAMIKVLTGYNQASQYDELCSIDAWDSAAKSTGSTGKQTGVVDKSQALAQRFGAKLLLVEDTPVNQQVSLGMLSQLGFEAQLAEDGAQAVALYRKSHFDLILMDIQMPVMDGYLATEKIREIEKRTGDRTPIVALTAHAMGGDRELCLQRGMDDHLAKPLSKSKLIDALLHWLPEQTASAEAPSAADPVSDSAVDPISGALAERNVERIVENIVEKAVEKSIDKTASKPDIVFAGQDYGASLDSSRPVLNVKTFKRLGDDLGSQALEPLMKTFSGRLPALLESIEQAYASQDADGLRRAAHRLKGSAYSLGAEQVGYMAEQLEHGAKDHQFQSLEKLVTQLPKAIASLDAAFTDIEIEVLCHGE